jgi:hypothetical protein
VARLTDFAAGPNGLLLYNVLVMKAVACGLDTILGVQNGGNWQ